MIKKVLIPNRGEIAVRIIKAAHLLGIRTIVTLSELEKNTLPAQLSDEVHLFQNDALADTFLNIELIIQLAQQYGADGIHPGYGFLSENYHLTKACQAAGLVFIGPSIDNLKQMGDKQMARSIAEKAQVPLTKSWNGTAQTLLSEADHMPYPVLVKAALGGGGKGMHICHSKSELREQLPHLSRQAKRYFGDERLYVEHYLEHARHIEVQVLADKHGNTVHLFERECSIQRRFQKLIEEAPAFNLNKDIKLALYNDALKLCQSINYSSAGTIEFLVDDSGQHYFLEMNTRIQVEHCVTEEITGIDLVKWQFKIANGDQLTFTQNDIKSNGHAIELRICAEDPINNFQPSPGQIKTLLMPPQREARIEIGIDQASTVHPQYDPMLAKIIVHDSTRQKAIEKAQQYNQLFIVRGIKTNSLYLNTILNHNTFLEGLTHTNFCETNHSNLLQTSGYQEEIYALAYVIMRADKVKNGFWRAHPVWRFTIDKAAYKCTTRWTDEYLHLVLNNTCYSVKTIRRNKDQLSFSYNHKQYHFYYFEDQNHFELIHQLINKVVVTHDRLPPYQPKKIEEKENNSKNFKAPIPSQVMKVNINEGQNVKKGDLLLILEAMKTENHIKAWKDGVIERIFIKAGDQVKLNQLLINYKD